VRLTLKNIGLGLLLGLVAGLLTMLCSCSATKLIQDKQTVASSQVDTTKVTDSSKEKVTEQGSFSHFHTETDNDTTVGGGEVGISLTATDLKAVTDADGEKQGRTFTDKKGHASATVNVGKDGSVRFNCECDSLKVANRRLVKDSIDSHQLIESMMNRSVVVNHSEIKDSTNVQKVVLEKKQGLMGRIVDHIKTGLALLGLIYLVIIIARILKKRP
jgi:hypothetical protein